MSRKYYTLAVREDNMWAPQFGDYSRAVVVQERSDMHDSQLDLRRKDTKVIVSGDKAADIQAAIDALNGGTNV